MGGKSNSSNATTSTNVSGQNAIDGDNLGTAISGVNNSTLHVTATDHGAVNKALALGGELINETGSMFENALKFAGGVNKDSLTLPKVRLKILHRATAKICKCWPDYQEAKQSKMLRT